MTNLDEADIQGNIHRPYGRDGFPHTRHLFFHLGAGADGAKAGRGFIDRVRARVTTAEPWPMEHGVGGKDVVNKPLVTLNIGFTWWGLLALGVPLPTLRMMPDEFIQGMAQRKEIVGDIGASDPGHWDPIWQASIASEGARVHVWVSLNAQGELRDKSRPVAQLQEWTDWLLELAESASGQVQLLRGHGRGADRPWQDSAAIMRPLPGGEVVPIPKEHFGFTDGIGDPVFDGQYLKAKAEQAVVGNGKLVPGPGATTASWQPLATGEFILGHPDEAQELPAAAAPARLMRNGTFMALRKLHQNIASFRRTIEAQAARYREIAGCASDAEARETLQAKMVGRWASGIPMMTAPTWAEHQALLARFPDPIARSRDPEFARLLVDFRYAKDPEGLRCPVAAHVRRANPRDMLDGELARDGTALTNRRRILRRGLPYGLTSDDDTEEHGVLMMALCASLFRQFEFIQQQWMHYGLDFDVGNDTCPIIGNREGSAKFVIPADPASGRLPFIAADLPQFVETRGGDYFFVPSLTALRMIAMGTIDPT
jgi:Dyp-type peroxidase family